MTLTLKELAKAADDGRIDTVLVAMVDMQGRLMGKRYHVRHFLDHHDEGHACNYLLATDLEMHTVEGYAATSWRSGYGDYLLRPDLSTLCEAPWLEASALVLCDVWDHEGRAPVPHSPRQVLKRQVERLEAMGFSASMATELEFFLFEKSYDDNRKAGYRPLTPISGYNEDYALFQTTKEENVMRPLRNHLRAAGIPVENTKGEAEAGQAELNIRYGSAMDCADRHSIAKQAVKEIAWSQGLAASFLPKWAPDRVGSSSHVHQSLWKDGQNAFADPAAELGMSRTLRHYMGGLMRYAPDCTVFMAPYVNSYKRFRKGTFAPTRAAWSVDNRTAGFRLVAHGTGAIRVECRIGGSDLNPYLACAAQIAAGIRGIEEEIDPGQPIRGDVYEREDLAEIPLTLRDAIPALRDSAMLRQAMGDDVVDHYTRAAEWEQEAFDAAVTDWEIARGFERA